MELLTKYLALRSEKIELKSSDFTEVSLKRNNAIRIQYALKTYHRDHTMAIIFYPKGKSLGAESAKTINTMFEQVDHVLLVCSKHSKTAFQHFSMPWEILLYEELEVDIFENHLMPRYELLSDEQVKTVATSWGMKVEEFKKCIGLMRFRVDPVQRLMGWKINSVIKVEESDVLNGCNTFYRLISEDQQF